METPANPDAQPPVDPGVEKIDSTINSYPDPRESDGPLYESTGLSGRDAPGPSTTYIPREPSPPLPDFRPAQHPLDDEMDELDEDDEVLATLPIYLSPSLYPHLSVFQYPLHHNPIAVPVWARDRGKTVTSRVKEAAGRVEVEIPIDGNVNVWREERAKEVGFVSESQANGNGDVEGGYGFGGRGAGDKDKKKKSKKDEQAKAWGEKSRLTSEVVPYATGYYSGVIQEGALHLHPITRVLQMRTNLTYLDDRDTEQKEHKRRYAEDMDGDKKKKAAPAQSRPSIPVDETNDGSGSIKDFRHKMWSLVQREEEDPWQEYAWKEGDNDEVVAKMAKLLVPPEKQGRLKCTTRGLDYLNKA